MILICEDSLPSSSLLKSMFFIRLSRASNVELVDFLQTSAKKRCNGMPCSQSRNGLPLRVSGRAGILLVSIPKRPLNRPTSTRKILHESPLTPFYL